jgi:hypothetical protein
VNSYLGDCLTFKGNRAKLNERASVGSVKPTRTRLVSTKRPELISRCVRTWLRYSGARRVGFQSDPSVDDDLIRLAECFSHGFIWQTRSSSWLRGALQSADGAGERGFHALPQTVGVFGRALETLSGSGRWRGTAHTRLVVLRQPGGA